MNRESTLDDLTELDPTLGKSLKEMLDFEGDVEEIFQSTFYIDINSVFEERIGVELIPDGRNVPITNVNRVGTFLIIPYVILEFVERYVKYYLDECCTQEFDAFSEGFHTVLKGSALDVYSHYNYVLMLSSSVPKKFRS
jgi:hypothetical protein